MSNLQVWATFIGSHLTRDPTSSPVLTMWWNWELTLVTNFGNPCTNGYQSCYWSSRWIAPVDIIIASNGEHLTHWGRDKIAAIFKCIFVNENVWISLQIWLKVFPKVPINNIPAMVPIMAWRCSGDKPLSEPMMISLLTHICITRPQWVNSYY